MKSFVIVSVFLSLLSPYVSAVTTTCGPITCIQDQSTDGTCDASNAGFCKCNPGSINSSDGKCVVGAECGRVICTADKNNDGTCDAAHANACNCRRGFANIADGTCVVGSTCGSVTCIAGGGNTGMCDTSNPSACGCNPGYAPNVHGTCVDVCETLRCTISESNFATCIPLTGCGCRRGYTNIADGTCMEGVVCSLKTRCNEENHNGSGLCITSNDEWCRCAEGFENDIFGQCIYSADGYEKAGSAVKPEDCKFSFLLALAIVVMAYVQWV
eukprot:Lankesteria_metandrocarpae@DN5434_c0_g1_i1.p1